MSQKPNNKQQRTEESEERPLTFSDKPARPESHPEFRKAARKLMKKYRRTFANLAK